MENLLDKIYEWGAQYGIQILGAIAILVIGRIVVGIIIRIIKRLMKRTSVDDTLTGFLTRLTYIVLMVFVLLAALSSLGVETTSFIAIIGAAGLAVGLALQGSLANFASGVMLIIFRPFKVGDFVKTGDVAGTIEIISIFNTVMKTPDNKEIIVPNGNITSGNITNYSAKETRRVDLVFGIGYDDDLRKAKSILERLLIEDERTLKDPAPMVAVSELADSSVNFIVRPWVKTADYWGVYWDLIEKVKLTFDAEGISIPYPQHDIHMIETAS
ncbi:MAG: mechanosensitive ion channel [candidate division Zixibacteria bacterium]|nr:mechanosensitive ion channel [candidate division Zixibacteria bacterium]